MYCIHCIWKQMGVQNCCTIYCTVLLYCIWFIGAHHYCTLTTVLYCSALPDRTSVNMEQIYRFGSQTTLPMPRSGLIAIFANAFTVNQWFWGYTLCWHQKCSKWAILNKEFNQKKYFIISKFRTEPVGPQYPNMVNMEQVHTLRQPVGTDLP